MHAARLDKPLKLLTFAMILLGVASVLLTGYLPPPQPLIVIAVLLLGFSFFWQSKHHNRAYFVIWHVITFIFLGWCFSDFFTKRLRDEDFIARIPLAAMQLSIFLQIFKVYNAKGDRDYLHMFLLSFFQFVSCAGVSVEFSLLPLLFVYLVVAMWTLILFHFRRRLRSPEAVVAAPAVAITGRVRTGRLLTAGFFTGALLTAVFIAIFAAFIFVFFPRTATSDNPLNIQSFLGNLGRRYTSGSGGSVDLNIAGIISQDPSPVMRVKFPSRETPPRNILWRQGAYHQYDGRRHRWNKSFGSHSSRPGGSGGKYRSVVNVLVEKSRGQFVAASHADKYNSIEALRNDPRLVEQRYSLLADFKWPPVFSAFSPPVAVIADVPAVVCNVDETFYLGRRPRGGFGYAVFSRLPARPNSEGDTVTPSGNDAAIYGRMKRFFTQLPSDLHPRFGRLARQITQLAITDYEKAVAVRNYLGVRCRYSLDLTQKPGRNGPLYDFLFADKPGHCEYFATAMVILLRELGIPTRLAYGYSSGQWDPDRRVFEVRRLDAHTWAEVFIQGKGWTPFDPSPVVPDYEDPDTFFSVLLRPLTNFLTFCEQKWAEGVIEYTRFKQTVIVRSVVTTLKAFWDGAKEYAYTVRFAFSQLWTRISEDFFLRLFVPVATMSILLALGIAGAVRIRRRGKFSVIYRRHQPSRHSGMRVKFYEKMLRLLMDKGIAKEEGDTPLEFAHRIASTSRPFSCVKTLTDLYYLVRFGHGKLSTEQSRMVQSILQRLPRLVPPRKLTQSRE